MPRPTRRPAKTDLLFQFKITLLDIKPAIWRRIQVPDCTLADLHEYIQAAFGWENYHLHQFEIDGVRVQPTGPGRRRFRHGLRGRDRRSPEQAAAEVGQTNTWIYEYDFGDGWRHEVLFEGFPPIDPKAKYPLCLEGERACPPEDCGGPWGYGDYLAAIADPETSNTKKCWNGGGRSIPEAFDAKKATKEMRKVK